MSKQLELALENNLVKQLEGQGYQFVKITDESGLKANLQSQLGRFNKTTFSSSELEKILNHLSKGNVFERAKTLRDRFQLSRDDGTSMYVQFFNDESWNENLYQVTNQVSQEGTYKNRYDVTILVNGLPLVQIELKRRGLEIKEAFNQINRYQRHSFFANDGLFQYVQVFVISNGVNTKYYANNRNQHFNFTFYWADENNNHVRDLSDFARQFLDTDHLGKMIAKYVVINETFKILMILRPYQYYAAEAIINQVSQNTDNGYIWHTTGSGKTLTSFKASQVIMDMPSVHKVVFVVDRKDLDYQTMVEFNSYKEGSVDVTSNTSALVNQFSDETQLIVTTIQKLNNAITKGQYEPKISHLKDKRIVFIFDECHRSQFGETHKRITEFFNQGQMFGFTGTPIFAENASKNDQGKRTTKDLFGKCLHKYVITDAIRDKNVLKFAIEYIGRYKQKSNSFIDIDVEAIDEKEVFDSPDRLEKITDYIIQNHDRKTHSKKHTAIFAVSSIKTLIKYYELFKEKKEKGEHKLNIATIFSYAANEDDDGALGSIPDPSLGDPSSITSHSRDKLESFIGDYNGMYGTSFSTKDSQSFENYYKDISKRIKGREKVGFNEKGRVDILLVVSMFLTGFDAKKVNTMYVDKNLRYHGIIQAFSRTNRILDDLKSQGNILCFRNLKKNVDEAIALFSNKDAKEVILVSPYEDILKQFSQAFSELLKTAPTLQSVDNLPSEEEELAFIKAFRQLIRIKNVLTSYTDFSWQDLPMGEQSFEDYKSKYLDLYEKVRSDHQKEKVSILEDIDFELELIQRDEINVSYILKLLANLRQASEAEGQKQRSAIIDILTGDVVLRSKRELIEKFIDENLPQIKNVDDIDEEFEKYWYDERDRALLKLCDDEKLDQEEFHKLIESYVYSDKLPIRNDVLDCLDKRPSVLKAKEIGDRIIDKMRDFAQIFIRGISA